VFGMVRGLEKRCTMKTLYDLQSRLKRPSRFWLARNIMAHHRGSISPRTHECSTAADAARRFVLPQCHAPGLEDKSRLYRRLRIAKAK
jgi:hypothetical protein